MTASLPKIKFKINLSYDTMEGASSLSVTIYSKDGQNLIDKGPFPGNKVFSKTQNQSYKILGLQATKEMQYKYPAKSLLKSAATYVKQAYDSSAGVYGFEFTGGKWPANAESWFKKCLLPVNPYKEKNGDIHFVPADCDELPLATDAEDEQKVEEPATIATHIYVAPYNDDKPVLMKAWNYQGENLILSLMSDRAQLFPDAASYGIFSDDVLSKEREKAQTDVETNILTYSDLDPSDASKSANYDGQLVGAKIGGGTQFIIGEKSLGSPALGLCTAVVYGGPNDGLKIVAAQCDLTPITELDKRILIVDSLPGDPSIMFPDWRKRDSCQPFKNESLPYGAEYWITVKTDYEDASIGEMPDRLREASIEGVEKLLDFYNKIWWDPSSSTIPENQPNMVETPIRLGSLGGLMYMVKLQYGKRYLLIKLVKDYHGDRGILNPAHKTARVSQ